MQRPEGHFLDSSVIMSSMVFKSSLLIIGLLECLLLFWKVHFVGFTTE